MVSWQLFSDHSVACKIEQGVNSSQLDGNPSLDVIRATKAASSAVKKYRACLASFGQLVKRRLTPSKVIDEHDTQVSMKITVSLSVKLRKFPQNALFNATCPSISAADGFRTAAHISFPGE